jgi:2-polyprenyl-6-methoxyphenol hydroxylase-like FAD-dependent oxidoreductase
VTTGKNDPDGPVPVLIAGGGPVGLALATELGMRGIRCVLAEKRDGVLAVPKMSQVSTRNMEFCRRWGIAEQVRTAVWSDSHSLDFVYLTTLTGYELSRQRIPSYATRGSLAYSPEGPTHCPQIYFDPILAAKAGSLPLVDLRYNTSLDSFTQDDDGVTATLVDGDGNRQTLRATYLVGCDGAGGMVRETLAIPLAGRGTIAQSINIFFRSPSLCDIHDKGWARFYRNVDETGSWAELIAIDGKELWRLTIYDHKGDTFDAAAYLRRCAGRDFEFEIISAQPWDRRDYVAETYDKGRVFIAGDSAHQCSPTGGMGMHTGVEEAVNLAWKLEAVLKGWGGPKLLASYDAERRPIAHRNVELSTQSYMNIASIPAVAHIGEDGPDGEAARAMFTQKMADTQFYSVVDHYKVLYCYEDSPVCVSDGTPPHEDTPKYAPSSRPGTRAPHAWLSDTKSTIDLFGDGFVLLRLGPAAPAGDSLMDAAAARGLPMREECVEDAEIAAMYEKPLVLVRPDGHVAWRGAAPPPDAGGVIDVVRGAA